VNAILHFVSRSFVVVGDDKRVDKKVSMVKVPQEAPLKTGRRSSKMAPPTKGTEGGGRSWRDERQNFAGNLILCQSVSALGERP
jgi:hypothetical protein